MKTLPVAQMHNDHGTRRWIALLLFACAAVLLTACSQEPNVEAGPSEEVNTAIATPTFAPTVNFAATDTPVPPTATATPAPTLTPTPDPAAVLREAQHAAFNGDDGKAVLLYQEALPSLPDAGGEGSLRARFDMAKSQLGAGDVAGALSTLTSVVSDGVTSTVAADARVLLGQSASQSGDATGALAHYEAALAAQPLISPYLQQWIGDAYIAANQPLSAVVPYQRALDGASDLQQTLARREKLALAYQLSGQFAPALDQYDAILAVSKFPAYRSRMLWESAQVLQTMGQSNVAYQRMQDIVNNYSNTGAAFSALQALIQAGQPVDELQRGIVDYYSGAHEAARQAFRRAISSDSRINEIRYWAALNYSELGSAADTYRNLNEIIGAGAGSPRYADALLKKGDLLAGSDDIDDAAVTYRLLASTAPADPQAPLALQKVGRLYERAGQIEQAAEAHLAAYTAYPRAEGAAEALLRSVIALNRLGRHQEAISHTETLLAGYPAANEALLARLWLGKGQIAAGQTVSGQATLAELAQSRPEDYEGTRAAELAADLTRVPLSKSFGRVPSQTVTLTESGQLEAETWLRARLNISDSVDIHSLQPAITADPRYGRGSELWRLGLKAEARGEFESLRAGYSRDALALYQLALYFRDIGLYRSSIAAADAVVRLTGTQNVFDAPVFLARLVYPIYYPDLVAQQADEFALDPLLVAGLIRQESLYEAFAASGASAYGLMQVIPPTGQEINDALNWPPGYSERDLTRPYVSIRFGTYYLARQRDFLKGDLYAAMAAYNGGPGMGLRWKDRSGGDPDVYYMTVVLDGSGYRETQAYIRTVATNYAVYHRLYAGD